MRERSDGHDVDDRADACRAAEEPARTEHGQADRASHHREGAAAGGDAGHAPVARTRVNGGAGRDPVACDATEHDRDAKGRGVWGAGASHMTRSMGSSSTRATCRCLHASVAVRGHPGPHQCERRAGPARPGARRRGRRKPRQGAVGGDRHAARRAGGALLAMPAPMLALPIRNSPCRRRRAPHRASLRSEDPADSVAAYGREIARRHGSRGSCEQTFTVLGYGHDPQTVTPAPRRCPWRER